METDKPRNYFGYGSNMNVLYLKHYLEACGASPRGLGNQQRAILHGYRFRTNCLTESSGGAANIEPHEGSKVEGVIVEVSPEILKVLRDKEDWPDGYKEITVSVEVPALKRNDVPAFTYIVTQKYALPFDQPVSLDYRHIILAGAHRLGLSEAYCQHLEKQLVSFVKHKKIRLMPG